ncbi:MAG: hypothetical protein IPK17_07485 [Chloroflexi bacterium]|uniref:hypothetical protein n=1 Tax=Candidatus Flexifilum breve TaxID=3140694 RepID=UPI0031354EA2|nr:hypothetical protein [Chloroflexota bacterium]
MSDEHYEHFVRANAGGLDAKLTIREDGSVECVLHLGGMIKPSRYTLHGRYEPHTDTYGWLRVERVTLYQDEAFIDFPIEALGCELIYEVIKLSRSPVLQHPGDVLWVSAHWNKYFDLLLFPIRHVIECYEGLKYVLENDELDDLPPDLRQHINADFMRHLEDLVLRMDKMKFARVGSGS